MAIRDILLQTASYPERTPRWAIDAALSFTEQLDARLSAMICQVHIPRVGNWLADLLVHANEAITAENAKSRENADFLGKEFIARVPEGRRGVERIVACTSMVTPAEAAKYARAYDLCIVPVDAGLDYQFMAEGLVFDSGRPVLLLPRTGGAGHRLETITVGWDGGRAAARALADALPVLTQAGSVRLVQVTGEKVIDPAVSLADIQRHLAVHGVDVETRSIPAEGRPAGEVISEDCRTSGADLLVIGAYGHSRMREFVLGGVTRHILDNIDLPILMAH